MTDQNAIIGLFRANWVSPAGLFSHTRHATLAGVRFCPPPLNLYNFRSTVGRRKTMKTAFESSQQCRPLEHDIFAEVGHGSGQGQA